MTKSIAVLMLLFTPFAGAAFAVGFGCDPWITAAASFMAELFILRCFAE